MFQVTKRSISSVIAKIERDFKPKSTEWIGDAYEWIGEAIQDIGAYYSREICSVKITVENYKFVLPCAVDNFIGLRYQGMKLDKNPNISSLEDITNWNSFPDNQTLSHHPNHYYNFKDPWFTVTFETGELELFYQGIPLDKCNMPMIPDNKSYADALGFYVIGRMILGGYNHPVFNRNWEKVNSIYENFATRARNEIDWNSLDDMNAFMDRWLDPTYSGDMFRQFYGEAGAGSTGITPGTRITNPFTIST